MSHEERWSEEITERRFTLHTAANHRKHQRLLTARDVADITQLDVKTLYNYVHRGIIPYVRIESSVRFPEDEILAWIEERTYRPRTRKPRAPATDDDAMLVSTDVLGKDGR